MTHRARRRTVNAAIALLTVVLLFGCAWVDRPPDSPPTWAAPPMATWTPGPTPRATATSVTPTPSARQWQRARVEVLGIEFAYPKEWTYLDLGLFGVVARQPVALNALGDRGGLPSDVVVVFAGAPTDPNTGQAMPAADAVRRVARELVASYAETARVELGVEPQESDGRLVWEFHTIDPPLLQGLAAHYQIGTRSIIGVVLSPEWMWSEHAKLALAVLESVVATEGTQAGRPVLPPLVGADQRGWLQAGKTVTDVLSGSELHSWSFRGAAHEHIAVELKPLDGDLDLTATLLRPDGTVLHQVNAAGAGGAENVHWEVPAEGRYALLVWGAGQSTGGYTLTYSPGSRPQPPPIEIGQVITGTLPPLSVVTWTLVASGGQVVDITLAPAEGMDVVLSVLEPDGAAYRFDDAASGQNEVVQGWVLGLAGDYVFSVAEYFGLGGVYRLAVDWATEKGSGYQAVDMGILQAGGLVTDTLAAGKYRHLWRFSAVAGDVVTITVSPVTASADLELLLIDPDGTILLYRDEYGRGDGEQIASYQLEDGGTYAVAVSEWALRRATYRLAVE